jgi:hypothetical protein
MSVALTCGGGASRAEARSGVRPFIEGMALRQLELVVAQPVEPEAAVVLLASRLVHRRIIGRVSFKRLALRFA